MDEYIISIINIIFLVICTIMLFSDLLIYRKNNKKIKISSQNKILFYKLKKQSLNNISINDIEQLRYFLSQEIKDRRKNENKKSR